MNIDRLKRGLKKIAKNPLQIILYMDRFCFFPLLSDETYLKILYRIKLNKRLNLNNPQTFNEKLQWLKLYNRKPEYTRLADKYEVKKYVAEIIGEEYIIPCLGVWDRFEDIDFSALPNQFVLKATHDCGSICICTDKEHFDINGAKNKLNTALKNNYFLEGREWPYKNIKPRIIADQYMVDESGYELKDYKFFVFNGEMKAMFIATDRNAVTETCFDFFDRDFRHLPFTNGHPNAAREFRKPDNFDEMIRLAEKLGKGIPQIRIDFYNINGKIYFGEFTFFHWGGMVPFIPEEWDYTFGSWIDLPALKTRG